MVGKKFLCIPTFKELKFVKEDNPFHVVYSYQDYFGIYEK